MKFRIVAFFLISFSLFLLPSSLALAQMREVQGRVLDAENLKPLPFATIGLRNYNIGTVSDDDGYFSLRVDEKFVGEEVTVSFIGYENFTFYIQEGPELEIILTPSVFQFNEVVIRSLSPEEYLKNAIKKISDNYLDRPFETVSYYSERVDENDIPIKYTEAAFLSYRFPYLLDSVNQHQLVLHQELAEDELQFLKGKRDKRNAKAARKAKKKGISFDKENEPGILDIGFLGPEETLKSDPVKSLSDFLDSTSFKKYKYEFGPNTVYDERPVEVLHFAPKGRPGQGGHIFIDKSSLAIIKISEKDRFKIPLALKPLLYAFGFSISQGNFSRSFKYKSFQGKWYPENIHHKASLKITKHNLFNKNEKAVLDLEIIFSNKRISTDKVNYISENKRFLNENKMSEQVYAIPEITWDVVN